MTSRQLAEARQRRLELAMFPLIGDDRFTTFLETVRELKEDAVQFAVSNDSVKSDRATLSALGEIRAYTDILGIAENYKLQLEAAADRNTEEAEQVS